jgi:hypothetical protein
MLAHVKDSAVKAVYMTTTPDSRGNKNESRYFRSTSLCEGNDRYSSSHALAKNVYRKSLMTVTDEPDSLTGVTGKDL